MGVALGSRRPAGLTVYPRSCAEITTSLCRAVEARRASRAWMAAMAFSMALLLLFIAAVIRVVSSGIGVWGNTLPVSWGWPVVGFVFWIGVSHAGTLLSAILYLFRQTWRCSINRFAESMTVIAVLVAVTFPIIHLGRPWLAHFLLPFPNQMQLWPQFRSPLVWDVFAVGTYGVLSLLFWYTGMLPDLAALRDRAASQRRRLVYGLLALGWRGSSRQWRYWKRAYLLLAGLATPLVLSVHSVVSFDFAVTLVPGWHSTLFPPYFVAGAMTSGVAMVITLVVPARRLFGWHGLIEVRHLEALGKLLLFLSLLLALSHATELFMAWYGSVPYERFVFVERVQGSQAVTFWVMIACTVVLPQLLWFKGLRSSVWVAFAISVAVNVGMWLERFLIVCTSLYRGFLPATWGGFAPTAWDVATLAGSFGLFFTLFLLLCRFLPMLAMADVKALQSLAAVAGGTAEAPHARSEP